jgi:hypothetical protein
MLSFADSAESGWTKAETDYLFKLLQDYNLRFYIVLDRYEWQGTLFLSLHNHPSNPRKHD